MALVSYSDSEGSDTESAPSAPSVPPPSKPKSSLASFLPPPSKKRKLVDDSTKPDATGGPRKIKIELPKITPDVDDVAPSSSRAKIGKSGGGGGMLSFLPAPKRTGAEAVKVAQESEKEEKATVAAAAAASSGAPRMLGGGIKKVEYAGTGMDLQPTVEDDPESEATVATEEALTKPPVETKPAGPIQGRVIQPFFRKSTTKKTTKPNGAAKKVEEKKVSLFSLGSALNEKPLAATTTATAAEYKPLLVEESAPPVEDEAPAETSYYQEEYAEASNQPAHGPQTFQSISEEVGMDEAEMRMFMGRRGRNAEIKLMDFNVDREYEKNEAARAAGELAPEKTVVRSIKSGKHQLTSLINNAQSQKAALEESFAQGRRNRKEAGSKYGW